MNTSSSNARIQRGSGRGSGGNLNQLFDFRRRQGFNLFTGRQKAE